MQISTKKGTVSLPCMEPKIVPIEKVKANDYNPNHVSRPNMLLLEKSIRTNGFCYPVVTVYDDAADQYIIVDGFHRYLIFRDYLHAAEIPVVVLEQPLDRRMAATVQFNRARGVHGVEEMGGLVRGLVEQGLDDAEIASRLGMELEEAYRLKQVTGIAELFKGRGYSKSWTVADLQEGES